MMDRLALILFALFALTANGAADQKRLRRSRQTPRSLTQTVTAALTGNDCSGAALTLSDGSSITWTRTTSATCTKAAGAFAVLTSGQPRCNTSLGCLIEPAATNLALYSDQLNNASGWGFSGTGMNSAFHQLNGDTTDVTDPFGGNSAEKLTCANMVGGEGATNICAVLNSWSMTGLSGSYTASLYGRTLSGTRTGYIWMNSGTPSTTVTCNRTSTWSRCTNTQTAPTNFRFGYDLRGQQTGQPAGDSYLTAAQLEQGTVATSYIPTTTTAVTRNADVASFSKPSWLSDTAGCVSATINVPTVVASGRILSFASGGSIYVNSATSISVTDGTNTVSSTVSNIAGRSIVVAASWTGSTLSLTADGVASSGSYDGTMVGSTAYLGSTSGTSQWLYGYVSTLKLGSTAGACP
jgi:hypothetical protein